MKKASKQKSKLLLSEKLAKSSKPAKSTILKVEKAFQKLAPTKIARKKSKAADTVKQIKKRSLLATTKAKSGIKVTAKLKGAKKLLSKSQEQELKKLHKSGSLTLKALCKKFNVSTATLYNYVNR